MICALFLWARDMADWDTELSAFLQPFLDKLGHKKRRQMCPQGRTLSFARGLPMTLRPSRLLFRNQGAASALPFDVTDFRAFSSAIAADQPFDILVNNAGMSVPSAFVDVNVEAFDSTINVNLKATYFAAQAVARKLIAAIVLWRASKSSTGREGSAKARAGNKFTGATA